MAYDCKYLFCEKALEETALLFNPQSELQVPAWSCLADSSLWLDAKCNSETGPALFDVTLGEFLGLAHFAEAIANKHGGIVTLGRQEGKQARVCPVQT
jgi:hypothetical protein